MKFLKLPISGAWQIITEPVADIRGQFVRLFCDRELSETGLTKPIVQVNHSFTKVRGAIRGMHYQLPPEAEVKIIKCLRGRVLDVLVDLRKNSPTFLQWHGLDLSLENGTLVLIPAGCAHGFQTLEPDTELLYFHTAYYTPQLEKGVRFDDPIINIQWPLPVTDISERDQSHSLIDKKFNGIVL